MNATVPALPVLAAPPAARPGRVAAVFKLHFTNPMTVIWQPLMIIGFIFAINWLIWLIAANAATDGGEGMSKGTSWSGASMFIFVWMLVVAVQAMSRTFHLALGFGATRRDYYIGTLLALATAGVGWAIVIAVLAVVEEATGGWGLGGHMFAAVYFGDNGPLVRAWYVFLIMLCFIGLGLAAGALWVRWRTFGLIAYFAALVVVLVGGFALIALTNAWQQVGAFFVGLSFAGAFPLLLIPTVVAAAVGYLALRRATARS